jgi:predicted nucleic acid-binding protein
MTKMLLPDINVWLALVFDAHVHHPSALAWFNSLSDETAFFCRLTQQGFLRWANNPLTSAGPQLRLDAVALRELARICLPSPRRGERGRG